MENRNSIHWNQLLALASLYASITIGWIAYYNYQPRLLAAFNLESLTFSLYVLQGAILLVTPILAGYLGDKMRKSGKSRMPVISAGVSLAAMIFMSVAFTLIIEPGPAFYFILPVLIAIWIFSMSLFTSPAISSIEMYAPPGQLPVAMAVLVAVFGLLYAIEPVILDLIDWIGATTTFAIGGIAVFASGFALKRSAIKVTDEVSPDKSKSKFHVPLILGIGVGVITTIIFNLLPDWFIDGLITPSLSGSTFVSIVLAITAIVSLPVGLILKNSDLKQKMLQGFAICLASIALIRSGPEWAFFLGSLTLILGFAIISIACLPLSFRSISSHQRVLGVGVFYLGFELPNSILEAWLIYQSS